MSLIRHSWSGFVSRVGGYGLILPGLCLGYALVMLSLCPATGLHGTSPYHRLQADALLHGHLWIGNTIDQLGPGLAWHNGHVQQVWGLGIGLWLLPFQAVWRLFNGQMFPDRLALGVAFAVLAVYASSTGLRIARNGQKSVGIGFIWLMLLCPPLWTLTRGSQLVFEETVLYGVLVCLGILVGLVRVALFDSTAGCVVICVLAALSGLVRPTLAIYGFGAVAVVSVILLCRRGSRRLIWFINLGFLAGLAFLASTNWARFGSPFGFGHRLTVNTDSMVYLTRFGNPYSVTPATKAAAELAGLLFMDTNVRDAGAYSDKLVSWQAPKTRWRRLYLTVFDPSYALICLAAVGGTFWRFARKFRCKGALARSSRSPSDEFVAALFLWSAISIMGLTIFYLRAPVIASRYLLDFLPAVMGLIVLAWWFIAPRTPKLSLVCVATWIIYELASAKVPAFHATTQRPLETALPRTSGVTLSSFAGSYSLERPPGQSGIAFNGRGWDPEGGFAGDIVTLVVDDPRFIELNVGERREFNGVPAQKDVYRARMDGKPLRLLGVTNHDDGLKVTFEVPPELQTGQQIVFLCFSAGYETEDRDSERFLFSERWK